MDLETFAREVEDAADCYSWGPAVLRTWLSARGETTAFERGLQDLAEGADAESALDAMGRGGDSHSDDDVRVFQVAVQLVYEGATPNTIRARLAEAAAPQTKREREAA